MDANVCPRRVHDGYATIRSRGRRRPRAIYRSDSDERLKQAPPPAHAQPPTVPRWSEPNTENYATLRKGCATLRTFRPPEAHLYDEVPVYAVPGANHARYIEDINRNLAEVDKSCEELRMGAKMAVLRRKMAPMPPIGWALDGRAIIAETCITDAPPVSAASTVTDTPPVRAASAITDAPPVRAASAVTDAIPCRLSTCSASTKSSLSSESLSSEPRGYGTLPSRTYRHVALTKSSEDVIERGSEAQLKRACRSSVDVRHSFLLDATEVIRRGRIERESAKGFNRKDVVTLPRRAGGTRDRRLSGGCNGVVLEPLYEHAVSDPVKPRVGGEVIPWWELATRKFRHRSCPTLEVLFYLLSLLRFWKKMLRVTRRARKNTKSLEIARNKSCRSRRACRSRRSRDKS